MATRTKDQKDQLRGMDAPRLRQELVDTKKELFNLRFMLATGASNDNAQIGLVKKKIARIHTVLREQELEAVDPARKRAPRADKPAKAGKTAGKAKADKADKPAKAEKPAKAAKAEAADTGAEAAAPAEKPKKKPAAKKTETKE